MSDQPTALITGASGAIATALAERLAADGWNLVRVSRSELPEAPGIAVVADATTAAGAQAGVDAALEHFGRLDGVANCIGSVLLKPAHLVSDDAWHDTLRINLDSAFFVLRASVKAMKKGGSVLLFSSAAARTGLVSHEAIAAAKAGVEGLTVSAAASYASRKIRVNAIAPGLVRSEMTAGITGNDAMLKASTGMHALGRIGEPDDIARAAGFLLDPANDWVTGQVLGVDGGLGALRQPPRA